MNKTLEAPEFAIPTDQVLRQIEDRINRHNRSRRRGGGAAVWMYEFDHEVAFLIRCGGSLKRDEIMTMTFARRVFEGPWAMTS